MLNFTVKVEVIGKKWSAFSFLKAITIFINSLLELLPYLKSAYLVNYILTHRLNQDCLENVFSQIRGMGRLHYHPNPVEFRYRLRALLISKSQGKVMSSNCADGDYVQNCVSATVLEQTNVSTDHCTDTEIEEEASSLPFDGDTKEKNVIGYIAGYVAKKLRLEHRDLGIPTFMKTVDDSWISKLSRGGLLQPSEKWLSICLKLEQHFKASCKDGIPRERTLTNLFATLPYIDAPKKAIELYFRIRLYAKMKYLNEDLSKSKLARYSRKKISKFVK